MANERPRERKARGLLSSYYGVGASGADPFDLDGPNFNSDKYVSRLLENQSLSDLVHQGNDMVTEIKSLDSDMQMLVYENYNKFISATDTIRSMKHKVEGMEEQMNQLASNMETIIESNRSITCNVTGRRGQLEKLNGVRKLLVKLQFLFELPAKLQHCVDTGEHAKAVQYYQAATSILKHYGHLASFQSIHDEAVDIMARLRTKLTELLAGVQPSLNKLAETVRLLLLLGGKEDELLQRFVAQSRALIARGLDALPPLVEQDQEDSSPAERMSAYCKSASDAYMPSVLEMTSSFAQLFPSTTSGGASSSSAAPAPSNAAIARRLAILQQAMDETFNAYAKLVTSAAHADAGSDDGRPAVEPLRLAIRALVEPARKIATAGAHVRLDQDALAKRAMLLGAELARGGIAAELRRFGDVANAAVVQLCADGLAPAGGAALVKVGAVRKLVHVACSRVIEAIDAAIQHVRPLLLALPAQGLVQELVETLIGTIARFVAQVREGKLLEPFLTGAGAHAEPSALFLCTAVCVELAQRMRTELQRLVAGHLMFAQPEYSAPLPIQQVVLQLEETADALNVRCVDLLARDLGEVLRSAVASTDWLVLPKPRAVSPYVEAVISHAARVLATFGCLFNDAPSGAQGRQQWVPTGVMPAPKQYTSRMKQAQLSASMIQSDIDRMFSRKISLQAQPAQSTRAAVGRLIKLSLKTLCELVRCTTLGRHGYQQLQVDACMLRWALQECVDDTTVLQALIDEVMTSAHERCLQPDPIETELIEALCDAKRQQLAAQPAGHAGGAGEPSS
ncbi:Vps51/Vps67-domain-containing protein [Pavlovales sp. CCMP2436]|nr:Vps51/Vps67-domain-containing protein [Pavlovales sp. CCMP2436]